MAADRLQVESVRARQEIEPASDTPPTVPPAETIAAPARQQAEDPPTLPDYRLYRKIGGGGQGTVWLGRNRHDGQYYAVKVLPTESLVELAALREYKRRVSEHPHLVPITHVGEHEGLRYYVMPLADDALGTSPVLDLNQYEALTLARYVCREGRLDAAEAATIGTRILEAIRYLHRHGARHGDVKPGNIMRVGGRWQLADHGLMSNAESREVAGCTPAYCPPEGAADPNADLYALGVTLWEMVTGQSPTQMRAPPAGETAIPGRDPRSRAMEAIIRRACEEDPSRRFASARDMLEALAPIGGRSKPRPALVWAAGSALVLLIVGAGLLMRWPWGDGERGTASGASSVPVKITSLRVEQYRDSRPLGDIGLTSHAARENDDARVVVELSEPAYCFVLALNPDGKAQRCYPSDDRTPPKLAGNFDSPVMSDGGPGRLPLTDGVGAQAFVVVASRDPLPPYGQWIDQLGDLPWRRFDTDGASSYDGLHFEQLGGERGEIRRHTGAPEPFTSTILKLRNTPGVHAVKGIVFPVRAKEAPGEPVKGGD